MADEEKPGDEVVLGKKFAGEQFSTVRSAKDVEEAQALLAQYADEHAVPLSIYFQNRRITDPVKQSMMKAYTKVQKATMDAFDKIFATF